MRANEFSLLIGGEAGDGIATSGYQFGKACMRAGFFVFATDDYQSTIRGGHNFNTVRASEEQVFCQADLADLVIAFNAETVAKHAAGVADGGGIIFEKEDAAVDVKSVGRGVRLFPLPMKKIVAEELKGAAIMRNTVALGAAVFLSGLDLAVFESVLAGFFKPEVAEKNVTAARLGFEYARKNFGSGFSSGLLKPKTAGQRIFLSGNEAVGLGALRAGCKFFAAYPMTPASGLLHFMVQNDREYGVVAIQPEGEISAINMVAGASFSGARAMTATSGGGFSLMSECFGMLGATETAAVVYVGQRPGPSTGLPTYTAQADLRFVMHASQGEFPRVIIAPGDVEECFYETMRAFNWADKYQLPVILLVDKYLAESFASVRPFDAGRIEIERGIAEMPARKDEYKRYAFSKTGVSPRVLPSAKGVVVRANADEHDESGFTAEDAETAARMIDKRMKKLEFLAGELEEKKVEMTKFFGRKKASATIIGWGSTKGPILEAMKILEEKGMGVNYLQVVYLQPFPTGQIERALKAAEKTIIVENNKTSQLSGLIRQHALADVDHKILKYDGRPFNPAWLAEKISGVL